MIEILKEMWLVIKTMFDIWLQIAQLDVPLLNLNPYAIAKNIGLVITVIVAIFGILNRILNGE